MLAFAARAMHKRDVRFPAGRTRLEPMAICINAVSMIALSLEVTMERTLRLLASHPWIPDRDWICPASRFAQSRASPACDSGDSTLSLIFASLGLSGPHTLSCVGGVKANQNETGRKGQSQPTLRRAVWQCAYYPGALGH